MAQIKMDIITLYSGSDTRNINGIHSQHSCHAEKGESKERGVKNSSIPTSPENHFFQPAPLFILDWD